MLSSELSFGSSATKKKKLVKKKHTFDQDIMLANDILFRLKTPFLCWLKYSSYAPRARISGGFEPGMECERSWKIQSNFSVNLLICDHLLHVPNFKDMTRVRNED